MPPVTIWREQVLPDSETFIANQMRAMRRWTPLLSGVTSWPNSLGVKPQFVVRADGGSPAVRADRWLYRRWRTSPRLQRQLARSRVVHAHFGPDGVRVARAARLARRPLVVTFHGYDATIPAAQLGIDYAPLFQSAARLVAVSQFIRTCLTERGAPEEKVTVVPLGIPVPADEPAPERRGVLFVGRLVEKKGCADLLSAVAGLDRPPPVEIIGDGPLRGDLERLAGDLRVPVRFRGSCPPAEVAGAMRRSAALCAPSRTASNGDREGLPIALLEAAAHRLPVVSYGAGGILEAVADGETGLLVPEGDVAGLARGLAAVLADPDLAARLGAAGRRRIETTFDIAICTPRLEALYDELSGAAA